MIPRAIATPGFEIAIANEAALSEDGWALIAPYGEHPKSRLISKPGGGMELEHYVQVVDQVAIDNVLEAQNRLMPRLKRALVGIPVYKMHPDLADHSPEFGATKTSVKETLGVIDKFRQTVRGLEAHFTLTCEGARVVAQEGFKFPSIFWWVAPVGEKDGAIRVRPAAFISAGLTPTPNIEGVDSLANSISASAPASGGEINPIMKNTLIGLLAAHGTSLANDSADTAVVAALNELIASKSGEAAALRAENLTLSGKFQALENAAASLPKLQTALQNERKARAGTVADLAIVQGRRAVCERETTVAALCNASDFDAACAALAGEAIKYKINPTPLANMAGFKSAALPDDPRDVVRRLTEKHMAESGDSDNAQKYAFHQSAVLAENPALAQALKTRPAA